MTAVVRRADPPATAPNANPRPSAADELMPFLVQSVCVDGYGRIREVLPIDAACSLRRPQSESDIAAYRKYDLPNVREAASKPLGYQASDAVVTRRGGRHLDPYKHSDFGGGDTRPHLDDSMPVRAMAGRSLC